MNECHDEVAYLSSTLKLRSPGRRESSLSDLQFPKCTIMVITCINNALFHNYYIRCNGRTLDQQWLGLPKLQYVNVTEVDDDNNDDDYDIITTL